jgi:hypothetical protein
LQEIKQEEKKYGKNFTDLTQDKFIHTSTNKIEKKSEALGP